jgi:hypothetical protein
MCRGKKKPVNVAGFFFTALVSKNMRLFQERGRIP